MYLTHEFVVVPGTALYVKLNHREPVAMWILAIVLLSAPLGALMARWFSEPMNRRLRGEPLPQAQA